MTQSRPPSKICIILFLTLEQFFVRKTLFSVLRVKIIQGVPKKSVNKETSITFELMNIVQGLHMFRHV